MFEYHYYYHTAAFLPEPINDCWHVLINIGRGYAVQLINIFARRQDGMSRILLVTSPSTVYSVFQGPDAFGI